MCSKNSSISIENWGVKKGIVCLWVDPNKNDYPAPRLLGRIR